MHTCTTRDLIANASTVCSKRVRAILKLSERRPGFKHLNTFFLTVKSVECVQCILIINHIRAALGQYNA